METYKIIYFKDCKNLQEVKNTFKNLAKANHPDKGGKVEIMQAINREYEIVCKLIMKGEGLTAEEFESNLLDLQAYKDAVNAIINLEGLIIECVGSWVWVTGNTLQHKETLKKAGYFYASKKKAWYFRTAENKVISRKKQSLDQIKRKYGFTSVASKSNFLTH